MTAILSPCGRYRYVLSRDLDPGGTGPTYAFFGINPSTADAETNDATVRKWIGFTRTWGGRRFFACNVSPLRSKNVSELGRVVLPPAQRALNLAYIDDTITVADILVPCWGSRTKAPKAMHAEFDALMARLVASGKPVMTLGTTASGDPGHPQMLAYATPLRAY